MVGGDNGGVGLSGELWWRKWCGLGGVVVNNLDSDLSKHAVDKS